jgi:hypothetical protein
MHAVCSHEREAVPGRVLSRPCESSFSATGWRVTEGSRGGIAGSCSCDSAARVCTIRAGPLRQPEIHYDGYGYDATAAAAAAAADAAGDGATAGSGSASSGGKGLHCVGQTKLVPLSVSTTGEQLRHAPYTLHWDAQWLLIVSVCQLALQCSDSTAALATSVPRACANARNVYYASFPLALVHHRTHY